MDNKPSPVLGSESVFMDSGAFSLYAINVGKSQGQETSERYMEVSKNRRGGEKLDPPPKGSRRANDFSYFTLAPGSEFRAYCDKYARFINFITAKYPGSDVTWATVDVIRNPEISWKVQKYFEQEHGLYPVPVIHGGADLRYLHRYLEEPKKYPLIGLGGLAGGVQPFIKWVDDAFVDICPRSNGYKPIVKVHGFAVTSWEYMIRWPWWSVDSTSWIKYAAYGWILVPPYDKKTKKFLYDKAPLQMNMSRKPTPRMHRSLRSKGKSPRQQKDNHYDNTSKLVKERVDIWLAHLGISMGAFEEKEEERTIARDEMTGQFASGGLTNLYEIKEADISVDGVSSSFRARAIVNLHYFKNLEEAMPAWPVPLDPRIIHERSKQFTFADHANIL